MIADGRAVDLWQRERKKNHSIITVELFETLVEEFTPGLEAEVQDIGRFLQEATELRLKN